MFTHKRLNTGPLIVCALTLTYTVKVATYRTDVDGTVDTRR